MKSLMLFCREVLQDLGTWCGTSTDRDLITVSARFEHEGLSFLTITLADFGKDFERSLELGQIADSAFPSFGRVRGLPRFLGGFLQLVFDRESGVLLTDPDITAIWAIRQFCLMWSKIGIACTARRTKAAIDGYVKIEQELDSVYSEWSPFEDDFRRIAGMLFGQAFANVDREIFHMRTIPRHGPGATAEKLSSNGKYRQREWPTRLEQVFPYRDNLFTSYFSLEGREVQLLDPGSERPVRVITVPKTQKTPRIIAIEPTCMQYMQQAVLEVLVREIEQDDFLSGFIGFSDQSPNRDMAKDGSHSGMLATLDLSEASDRVSVRHVESLLCRNTLLREAAFSTRSTRAEVPGYGVITLSKYASMGSALCFPFEACVFLTLVFLGLERAARRPLSRGAIQRYKGRVRVYGDDIIVPADCAESVIAVLETFGLKVNSRKSFWNGKFRESCGGDYYSGQDVTPVRVRSIFPTSRKHVSEIRSTVSLRNQLYKAGLWRSVGFLDDLLGSVLSGYYPAVAETSQAIGKVSFLGYTSERFGSPLQLPLVRAYVASDTIPVDPLDGEGALLKFFLKRGSEPHGRKHLERAGRSQQSNMKLRWTPSY